LETETEGFRELMNTKLSPIKNQEKHFIRVELQK
jgi:hypothetical protein